MYIFLNSIAAYAMLTLPVISSIVFLIISLLSKATKISRTMNYMTLALSLLGIPYTLFINQELFFLEDERFFPAITGIIACSYTACSFFDLLYTSRLFCREDLKEILYTNRGVDTILAIYTPSHIVSGIIYGFFLKTDPQAIGYVCLAGVPGGLIGGFLTGYLLGKIMEEEH